MSERPGRIGMSPMIALNWLINDEALPLLEYDAQASDGVCAFADGPNEPQRRPPVTRASKRIVS